jgi:ABC-type transport system involved in cytochrome c biogenesis permease subunit
MNRIILATALTLVTATTAFAQSEAPSSREPWSDEIIDLFETLPIQEGGRIKPLETYASFLMLRINGKRSHTLPDDTRLKPMEWFLDCMFYPDIARNYKTFITENSEILAAVGIDTAGKKRRDWYSYEDILPGRQRLFEMYGQFIELDQSELEAMHRQTIDLAQNVFTFETLMRFMEFARHDYPAVRNSPLASIATEASYTGVLDKASTLRFITILLDSGYEALMASLPPEEAAKLRDQVPEGFADLDAESRERGMETLNAALNEVLQLAMAARGSEGKSHNMLLLPPSESAEDEPEWLNPGDLAESILFNREAVEPQLAMTASLEKLPRLLEDRPAFTKELQSFHDQVVGVAEGRNEYGKVPLEVFYYNSKFFFYSQWLYVLSFVLVGMMWLKPDARVFGVLIPTVLSVPTLLLIAGITVRCIIRERPPVTTLYETILFITAVAVVCCIAIEFMNRQRLAISMGAILGTMGMFLANKYEIKEGVDTMPSLVAVLDTNFWLSTHVTTVVMGYAAGLLAAAIAHVYVLGKVIGIKKDNKTFYKNVSRMTYGVLCFGLLFATVGTILGGIWANDSWGRFWGWDPKENGALMIVLWQLAILHARMGGYIRDLGVCLAAIAGGMVVAFSWWGVNLLGVGLHSYGFTSGVQRLLMTFYAVESVVILLGMGWWIAQRMAKRSGGLQPQS